MEERPSLARLARLLEPKRVERLAGLAQEEGLWPELPELLSASGEPPTAG